MLYNFITIFTCLGLILASIFVVVLNNTVLSLFALVLVLFFFFILLLLMKFEFLAYAIFIIYLGAIIILFLFAIMVLNLKEKTTTFFLSNSSLIAFFSFIILSLIWIKPLINFVKRYGIRSRMEVQLDYLNGCSFEKQRVLNFEFDINIFNTLFYSQYGDFLVIISLLLLAVMIGSIALVFQKKRIYGQKKKFD